MELKKIGVFSLAKIQAILMAIMGLLVGIFYAILGTAMGPAMGAQGANLLHSLGLLSIVIMPIFYGVFGFISGLIGGFLYNIVAGAVGGVELHFKK
ncbi:hypothetical protein KY346_00570 [Candidatus Woesearchaeota archaeon]|nr:hypothetical protein [Candidatus Woesearchaeota archaeon]